MRLIDADILSEEIKNGAGTDLQKLFADICLATAPTIDAVPVVRCRECRHYKPSKYNASTAHYCGVIDGFPKEDWYCADGQRREDGLYESLKRGLEEAIAFENGEIECKTETREDGDA